ncbi:MAG: double-strand break repair helicase AddA [Pseudomonadota bacterium]
MAATDALPELKGQQRAASDPATHVWLSASAGTGKTQVLAARVFRLLLGGTKPEAILCLTFTKAGAAEMAGRINARLAAWVRMPDERLVPELRALGESGTLEMVAAARTLFAKVLDAPGGGLRIQTIHGFCQSLLAAFPVEAELAPGFRPLEAREEAVLARETLAALLVAERAAGRERTIDAVGALSLRLGEGEAEKFLLACAKAPDAMAALPLGTGVVAFVRRALDVPSDDVMEHLAGCCGDDAFDLVGLRRIAAANRAWGAASGVAAAEIAENWVAADPPARVAMLGELVGVVHTQKGELRSVRPKLSDAEPDYEALARSLGSCCTELLGLIERARFAELYAEALMAGRDYAAAYTAAKRRAGAVDFDDLIRATVELLEQPAIGDWVRYKLDQETEHVLIDEAQDTNLAQWKIVENLASEFFAGIGTRGPRTRTLFTVGDHKQAIFGFQGTDPIFFRAAERKFAGYARDNLGRPDAPPSERGLPMAQLSLTHSFRSTRPILEFVDAALVAVPDPGLGTDSETHASEVGGPGLVELWPPIIAGGDADDEEGWIDDATRKLAKRIAKQIRGWLDDPGYRNRFGQRLTPQDVMILVKRRGDLASLIVARLYAEGVPVAGIDRLRLNAPLAVQDLLAAVRFVLQPDDSLALASLLVSPLLGWTQDELMEAAARRLPGVSLWGRLRDRTDPRLAPLFEMLRRADIVSPYRFLEEILSGPLRGRRKLLARLGAEARDPIEELLSAALAFETTGTPSLQAFLDWFDRGDVDIVRDPSQPLDTVRVMTAHGAKGLQAPVVILADALIDPGKSPRSILAWQPPELDVKLPLLRPRAAERSGPIADVVAAAARRDLEEHWRLFYVAATRAEERLVIAGALGAQAKGPPEQSWYAAADAAMTALGVAGDGVRSFAGRVPPTPLKPKSRAVAPAAVPSALPEWTQRTAPVEARPPRPLAPSSLGEDAVADPPPSAALRAAAERGRLLHALFERLPPVALEHRAAAAERWLAGAAGVADAAARSELIAAACRVIDDPRFAEVFGSDALAEAPIAAVIAGGAVVAGTVDRLLVTPERVQVIDFKTGRSAPARLGEIPSYHIRQMAAYVAALRAIFPDRTVSAALLYTAAPVLFELPDELISAHLPRTLEDGAATY